MATKEQRKRKLKERKLRQERTKPANGPQVNSSRASGLKPWKPVKMALYQMPSIFPESMTEDERFAVMREVAAEADEVFRSEFSQLSEWFERFDALYLLSFCAFYFVSYPEGTDRESKGRLKFYEFYLEILQAFALTRERSRSMKPLGEEATGLHELMGRLGDATYLRHIGEFAGITDRELKQRRVLADIRTQTQAVRNWAYPEHMRKVTGALAENVRDDFFEKYGVDPVLFVNALLEMIEAAENRLNSHLDRIRSVYRQGNPQTVASMYVASFPHVNEFDIEELFDLCGRKLKNFKLFLAQHSDLMLSEIYTFTLDDIVTAYGEEADRNALKNLFDELSFEFGSLRVHNSEHFILDNPVWARPFIKIDDETYFSSVIGILPHCTLRIVENLIQADAQLREKYSYRKARYLEDELESLFKESFPSGRVYRGSRWNDGAGNQGENDLSVVVGSVAIVVEAKSGLVTPSAARGAPARFRRTVRELIDDPAEQAHKFIDFLKSQHGTVSLQNGNGGVNILDTRKIRYFIPLTVTLENLGSVSNLRALVEAGISERELKGLSTVISLTDLIVIFDILDLQSQRIHYLARRREFEAHVQYHGDELDLLAFYLNNGFNIGEVEYTGDRLVYLSLFSKELDPYFIAKASGLSISKPTLALTPWWEAMLTRLDMGKSDLWLEASLMLLSVRHEKQRKAEHDLSKLSRRVKRGKVKLAHNWISIVTGPSQRRFCVSLYPYLGIQRDERNGVIVNVLERTEARESRGALCIGIDLDHPEVPYAVLAANPSPNLFDELQQMDFAS